MAGDFPVRVAGGQWRCPIMSGEERRRSLVVRTFIAWSASRSVLFKRCHHDISVAECCDGTTVKALEGRLGVALVLCRATVMKGPEGR